MRKLLVAAAAGASVLGGAMIAQPLQAQPDGDYVPAPPYYAWHYDSYGRRYFEDANGRHYDDDRDYDAQRSPAPCWARPSRKATPLCPTTATAPTRTG